MNKQFLLLLSVCLLAFTTFSQTKKSQLYDLVTAKRQSLVETTEINLFSLSFKQLSPLTNSTVEEKQVLSLQKQASLALYNNAPVSITVVLPQASGANFKLELIKEDISTTNNFSYGNASEQKRGEAQGIHYRGYLKGDASSIAAFSVFSNGDVMALFSNEEGNFNVGRAGASNDEYILYNSRQMRVNLGFECGTAELPPVEGEPMQLTIPLGTEEAPLLCKKVRLYWEGDYKLYANNFNSNLVSTTNYLTGLFNQVAVMYLNEGILIELTNLFIWTAPNGYNNSTSSNGLNSFKSRWNGLNNTFKGDLAVLIDGAPTNNGGVAYLLRNNLCNRSFAYGYADIYGYYNALPTYSWDVEVVTHEMGHMMGSNHTQWCGWNTGAGGTCGAIDDCYTLETVAGCSTCVATTTTNPSPPTGFKGTVMSYCHLRSGIGINLANGFGPLPQAAIRSTVSTATCNVFSNKWTGTFSTAWEDFNNWSCGSVPTSTTDVIIHGGLTNYPVINSAAICRKIKNESGASILVNTGYRLSVVGTTDW